MLGQKGGRRECLWLRFCGLSLFWLRFSGFSWISMSSFAIFPEDNFQILYMAVFIYKYLGAFYYILIIVVDSMIFSFFCKILKHVILCDRNTSHEICPSNKWKCGMQDGHDEDDTVCVSVCMWMCDCVCVCVRVRVSEYSLRVCMSCVCVYFTIQPAYITSRSFVRVLHTITYINTTQAASRVWWYYHGGWARDRAIHSSSSRVPL